MTRKHLPNQKFCQAISNPSNGSSMVFQYLSYISVYGRASGRSPRSPSPTGLSWQTHLHLIAKSGEVGGGGREVRRRPAGATCLFTNIVNAHICCHAIYLHTRQHGLPVSNMEALLRIEEYLFLTSFTTRALEYQPSIHGGILQQHPNLTHRRTLVQGLSKSIKLMILPSRVGSQGWHREQDNHCVSLFLMHPDILYHGATRTNKQTDLSSSLDGVKHGNMRSGWRAPGGFVCFEYRYKHVSKDCGFLGLESKQPYLTEADRYCLACTLHRSLLSIPDSVNKSDKELRCLGHQLCHLNRIPDFVLGDTFLLRFPSYHTTSTKPAAFSRSSFRLVWRLQYRREASCLLSSREALTTRNLSRRYLLSAQDFIANYFSYVHRNKIDYKKFLEVAKSLEPTEGPETIERLENEISTILIQHSPTPLSPVSPRSEHRTRNQKIGRPASLYTNYKPIKQITGLDVDFSGFTPTPPRPPPTPDKSSSVHSTEKHNSEKPASTSEPARTLSLIDDYDDDSEPDSSEWDFSPSSRRNHPSWIPASPVPPRVEILDFDEASPRRRDSEIGCLRSPGMHHFETLPARRNNHMEVSYVGAKDLYHATATSIANSAKKTAGSSRDSMESGRSSIRPPKNRLSFAAKVLQSGRKRPPTGINTTPQSPSSLGPGTGSTMGKQSLRSLHPDMHAHSMDDDRLRVKYSDALSRVFRWSGEHRRVVSEGTTATDLPPTSEPRSTTATPVPDSPTQAGPGLKIQENSELDGRASGRALWDGAGVAFRSALRCEPSGPRQKSWDGVMSRRSVSRLLTTKKRLSLFGHPDDYFTLDRHSYQEQSIGNESAPLPIKRQPGPMTSSGYGKLRGTSTRGDVPGSHKVPDALACRPNKMISHNKISKVWLI
ncbi:hypothetical protein CCUS01_08743 [Colletotrichum cuscutae]|uniref:Uncharacterized protein n=1 Tax=Colletotrichum cuscutae TaxID=1209917 RepID=A0AAI9ULD4_9PEZI|nr:hypothetical protein CCUS01_08743 [Colletotrichum cuscutae]